MKSLPWLTLIMLSIWLSPLALGQNSENVIFFEEEKTQKVKEDSFTAHVEVIREIQGVTEVVFSGKSGFYRLETQDGEILETLTKAKRKKKPVQVKVQNRNITSVEEAKDAPSGSEDDWKKYF